MSAKTTTLERKIVRPKLYVVGGGYEYIKLMYTLGFDGATGLDDADAVLFTGGEDVNPELYKEPAMAQTRFSCHRDEKEKAIFDGAVERELPMVGICRGGQLLNVLNGGSLWQHVTNHAIGGKGHIAYVEIPPYNEKLKTAKDKRRVIEVTSTHHQMMIPADHGMVLLTALEAYDKQKHGYSKTGKPIPEDPDVEAVYYDDTHCLCFQPHPEFSTATPECVDFFEECLDNFIHPNITIKELEKAKEKKTTKKKEKK